MRNDKALFRSQPCLKVRERAVPVKELNDNSKKETRDMENPDCPVLYSPECTKNKKEYPEKMDEDDPICKNPVRHPLGNRIKSLRRRVISPAPRRR